MDFSFVETSSSGQPTGQPRHAPPQPAGPPAGAPPRPLIQIPSWQEVQAAQKTAAPTIIFRPTGLLAAARQQDQLKNPQGPPPSTSLAPNPPPAPPTNHHNSHHLPPHTNIGPGPSSSWQGSLGPGVPGPSVTSGPLRPAAAPYSSGAYGGTGGPAGGSGGGGGVGPSGGLAASASRGPVAKYAGLQSGPVPPPNVVLVNRRQQGNPVLKHIRNVRWQFADIVPDYQLGQTTAALFLSLRYHLLHPEYILHRIKEQQRLFRLTVLLVWVDVEEAVRALGDITRAATVGDCALVCAWSAEECARWLETYKSYESKPASSIQERVDPDYLSRLTAVLSGSVRGINRTDAHVLGTSFGSLGALLACKDADALSACPGIGPTKVRRLLEAFHEPFRKQLRSIGPPAVTAAAATNTTLPGHQATSGAAGNTAATGGGTAATNGGGGAGGGGRGGAGAGASGGVRSEGAGAMGVREQVRSNLRSVEEAAGASGEGAVGGAVGGPVGASGGGGASEEGGRGGEEGGRGEGGEGEGDADAGDGREGTQEGETGGEGDPAASGGDREDKAARRRQVLEVLLSQMPAGDDDVSDDDDVY